MSHKTSTICLTSDQAYFVPCTGRCDWEDCTKHTIGSFPGCGLCIYREGNAIRILNHAGLARFAPVNGGLLALAQKALAAKEIFQPLKDAQDSNEPCGIAVLATPNPVVTQAD
jgi:hypothetical protein